jgi:hypothetical protein
MARLNMILGTMTENPYMWRAMGKQDESRVTEQYKRAFELACERGRLSPDQCAAILKEVGLG